MKFTATIRNERGQELVWHNAEFRFGDTITLDGIEVREKLTHPGQPPAMDTVLWLAGTIEVKVEK
jgi:hypothetical protein